MSPKLLCTTMIRRRSMSYIILYCTVQCWHFKNSCYIQACNTSSTNDVTRIFQVLLLPVISFLWRPPPEYFKFECQYIHWALVDFFCITHQVSSEDFTRVFQVLVFICSAQIRRQWPHPLPRIIGNFVWSSPENHRSLRSLHCTPTSSSVLF